MSVARPRPYHDPWWAALSATLAGFAVVAGFLYLTATVVDLLQ